MCNAKYAIAFVNPTPTWQHTLQADGTLWVTKTYTTDAQVVADNLPNPHAVKLASIGITEDREQYLVYTMYPDQYTVRDELIHWLFNNFPS